MFGYLYYRLDSSGNVIVNGFADVKNITSGTLAIPLGNTPSDYPKSTNQPDPKGLNAYIFAQDPNDASGEYAFVHSNNWTVYISNGQFILKGGISYTNNEVYTLINGLILTSK
ncbi:hypothetical protein LASUN_16360 [Lentilactobacillus sunkii]|uniref:Uncharacterized protein n=1 Tax=Lentilactobacillus sunkii TaxID=481719 RepID=A0A1E7XCG2_9LACO|nr:hypothetical protein [Lentilactobacillus sunkii]OFA10729.1 hypothetical protein LASUN_16360 [Lentilactobacillus sunkii]